MTPEEAIKHGKEQLDIFGGEHHEFIEMAIKALEQQPCEDCISREAVRRILANQRDELIKLHTVNPKDNPKADAMAYGVNWSLNTLMELPSVTPSYNSIKTELKNPKAKTFDILHFVADNAGLSTFEAIEKAYNMGVSEQETVLDVDEDCISREDAKNLFWDGTEGYDCRGFTRMEIGEMLDDLPSVTPRAKGKWIQTKDECEGTNFYNFSFECSECGREQSFKSDYCPNCGAKMESEDKE